MGLFADGRVTQGQDAPIADGKRPQQKLIRISKETTRWTSPLTEDGFVDYITGANERRGKGVTRANNAAFDFVRIMDPNDEWGFHKELGIKKTDVQTPFGSWVEYTRTKAPDAPLQFQQKLLELRDELSTGPWKAEQGAMVADWLEANKVPLDLLAEATKKPRFYTPWAPEDEMVAAISLPLVQDSRELARALKARAMLRLGAGDNAGAWNDLQAMHRLARMVGQGATLIEGLVAVAIEGVALNSDVTFIQSVSLSPEEIARYQTDLEKLPPLDNLADSIDTGERIMFLDVTQLVARDGLKRLAMLTGESTGTARSILDRLMKSSVDWNETLIVGNEWYDRCVEVLHIESLPTRRTEWDQLQQDLVNAMPQASGAQLAKLLFASKKAKGRHMGVLLVNLTMPALGAASNAGSRSADERQLAIAAFALEAYKEKNGKYPASLDALVPRHLKAAPQDLFLESPYKYETDGSDFRLYGVGQNFEYDNAKPGADNVVTSKGWKPRE